MYLLSYKLITHEPWNKGKLIGQKPPLKLKEIWAIRIRLQLSKRYRDIALFNLAIDSKLRACDLVRLKVSDVVRHLLKLAYLAPDIIQAICKGNIPPDLSLSRIKKNLPLDWTEQRKQFSFPA